MARLFTNNATSRLASAILSSDLAASLVTGGGAEFPTITGSDYFVATLIKADASAFEIVKVTARSTDALTIVRAQEGTTAVGFAAGDTVALLLTAAPMTEIEAFINDAELSAIAGLTSAADKGIQFTGSGTAGVYDLTTAGKALLDDADAAAQRTTLGLGTAATLDSDTDGTLAANSDSKVATQKATKTALDLKAPLASPALTGSPTVPTQSAGDNSTKAASTAYADNAVAKQKEVLMFAVSDESTAITTGTAKLTFRMPFAMTLTEVRANLNTVSSSGNPAIDINEGGVSIFSTTLTIDSGEKTSTTAATPAVISDASLADDAEMTVDIDTAGTGAKGLKITLIGTRT